ncbi:MAG: hypothetical protein LBM75_04805, partial [Myxococcales bacterium]|nr:hypothetical protein [Myxococcales bacterium]
LAPGLGDDIQAMKAGLIEVADLLVINKGDLPGAEALQRDLEPIARERDRALLKVSARDGLGIDALVTVLDDCFAKFRQSGELKARRSRSSDAEALDWALELVRDRLAPRLTSQPEDVRQRDPRARAEEIVRELFS